MSFCWYRSYAEWVSSDCGELWTKRGGGGTRKSHLCDWWLDTWWLVRWLGYQLEVITFRTWPKLIALMACENFPNFFKSSKTKPKDILFGVHQVWPIKAFWSEVITTCLKFSTTSRTPWSNDTNRLLQTNWSIHVATELSSQLALESSGSRPSHRQRWVSRFVQYLFVVSSTVSNRLIRYFNL